MKKYILRRWYSFIHGFKMKPNYSYKRIGYKELWLLEDRHYELLKEGWDRVTDIYVSFGAAYCWYERLDS